MKLEKLYDISFPFSNDKDLLYFQGHYEKAENKIIIVKGDVLDLGTYFNSFSIKKWINYTTIKNIKISLNLKGKFEVEFYGINAQGEEKILNIKCEDFTEKMFNVFDFGKFDLIGIRLTAMSERTEFIGGSYYGLFDTECDVKLGITICTFKREKYLLPNLDKLKLLTKQNDNINIMVIDNGRTLDEICSDKLQIIHNPNFGGSGGFTRGLIEQANQNVNTHVILMDDDIVIELSSIDRLYSMLKHLKIEHQEKFFGGAMLRLDKPTIQYENTAQWNKIKIKTFGRDIDLSNKSLLCKNEHIPKTPNQYAAWWFCCIPIKVVKEIGYPLPIFIKGDDMEYSIRNNRDILTMNGVGVWHETFANKYNPVIRYFSDRNMLLINHFADGCGRFTFLLGTIARIGMRIIKGDFNGLRMMELALTDLNSGLEGITLLKSDEKFESLKKYPLNKNIFTSILSIIKLAINHFYNYDELEIEYKRFRNEKLSNQIFWRHYLDI